MDIWHWLEKVEEDLRAAGQPRIADMIYSIPDDVNEDQAERVEAALPEAIAAARSMNNQWLEIFFRHWGLQNKVKSMAYGANALDEAINLMEFSHRPENIDCPQSVCVVHDLGITYGNTDADGWALERLAVTKETLDRIEPARNCYDCISREHSTALCDLGRLDDSLTFLENTAQAMSLAGNEPSLAFILQIIHTHSKACHFDKALELINAIDFEKMPDNSRSRWIMLQIDKSYILANLDRIEEAKETLPSFDDITHGDYESWANAAFAIATRSKEHNTWNLGARLQTATDYLTKVQSHRFGFNVACIHAKLAMERGSLWIAKKALKSALYLQTQLRKDCGAQAKLDELSLQYNKLKEDKQALPVDDLILLPDELLKNIQGNETRSPEIELESLLKAHELNPDHEDILLILSSALNAIGSQEDAINFLERYIILQIENNKLPELDDQDNFHVLYELLDKLSQTNQTERILKIANMLKIPKAKAWYLARLAMMKNDDDAVIMHCQSIIAEDTPERHSFGALSLMISALQNQDNLDAAIKWKLKLISYLPEDEQASNIWDLLEIASCAQNWEIIRKYAPKLGMKLTAVEQDNAAVIEEWGMVIIRFEEEGKSYDYYAQRTGPCTATIIETAHPAKAQHLKDNVVFSPQPIFLPDDLEILEGETEITAQERYDKELESFVYTSNVRKILTEGGYQSWFIDGAKCSEEQWQSFTAAIESKGWDYWIQSSNDYEVTNPHDSDAPLAGRYFSLAVPKQIPLALIDQALHELTHKFEHPWCWLLLAKAADIDVTPHQYIIDAYDL